MHREARNPSTLPPPAGYSQIVEVSGGTTVYIAGQVAWDTDGEVVGVGDFEAQARQVFANLVEALAAAGATPSDLVKIGIYVVDHTPEKLGVIRRVRDELLGGDPPPTSTLIGVQTLALPDLLIEVDAIAVVD
ncbi:MAG: RidA family protein [Acidimicrobiia bacterium]